MWGQLDVGNVAELFNIVNMLLSALKPWVGLGPLDTQSPLRGSLLGFWTDIVNILVKFIWDTQIQIWKENTRKCVYYDTNYIPSNLFI
jgi:hypothetical protein